MRIRMLSIAAGPGFSASPGDVVDLPNAQAAELIRSGYADKCAAEMAAPEIETESVTGPENASAHKGKGRAKS